MLGKVGILYFGKEIKCIVKIMTNKSVQKKLFPMTR
jgi:hypothetical protein